VFLTLLTEESTLRQATRAGAMDGQIVAARASCLKRESR
jgi:hypothetical protein